MHHAHGCDAVRIRESAIEYDVFRQRSVVRGSRGSRGKKDAGIVRLSRGSNRTRELSCGKSCGEGEAGRWTSH